MTLIIVLIAVAVIASVSFAMYQQNHKDNEKRCQNAAPPDQTTKSSSLLEENGLETPIFISSVEEKNMPIMSMNQTNVIQGAILVVDDQPSIRMLIGELFSEIGATVYEAENGTMALDLFKKHSIDCILLDLKMPDMTGIEVLRGIREMSPDVPVILITAYIEPHIAEEANKLGVSKLLSKPFDIHDMKKEVIGFLAQ